MCSVNYKAVFTQSAHGYVYLLQAKQPSLLLTVNVTPGPQDGGMCLLLISAARFITCNSLTFPFFTLTFLNRRVWG